MARRRVFVAAHLTGGPTPRKDKSRVIDAILLAGGFLGLRHGSRFILVGQLQLALEALQLVQRVDISLRRSDQRIHIGAVAGHLSEIGYGSTFWSFVIGHGAFELTAITLAGAAGLQLGWALIAPGRHARSEALRLAAAQAVKLVAGVVIMLLIAAFVEAYWSSMTLASSSLKYWVGAALWLLVAIYFLAVGRGTHAPD